MKNKKTLIGLVIVLVCLILCVALLLTQCSHAADDDKLPSETGGETSEPTVEPTNQAIEETEPTTDATESTDPTVPETVPEEESSDGGSSTPGGTGGFIGGTVGGNDNNSTDDDSTDDNPTIPNPDVDAPGTGNNAYTEILGDLPDTIGSVKIPANGTIYYNVYQTGNTVLTIADADAYIIYDGTTYKADENGVVTVELTAGEEENVPVSFQLGSKASAEKAFTLNFTAPLGSASNPEQLTSLEQITVTIGADSQDGYYYSWTASENGTLTLTLDSIDPEDAQCEILLNLGETCAKLSDSKDGTVSLEVQENDEVIIVVSVKPEGTEAKVVISGSFTPSLGSKENPYVEIVQNVPGSFKTAEIPAGKELYYDVYNVGTTILTIEDPNAYVIYSNVTYVPNEDGVISFYLEAESNGSPVTLMIGNSGETEQSFLLTFTHAPGSMDNPMLIEDISEVIANVPKGWNNGYYLQWVATDDGVLSFTAAAEPESAAFDVTLTCGDTNACLSDGSPVTLEVVRGDVVNIQITMDPAGDGTYPAAEITLTGSLTITYGTANNPYTAVITELPGSITTVEIPAGETVYYELSNVSSTIMTINDPTVSVIYNGVTYTPDETGVLTLEVKASSSRSPVSLQIGNGGETAQSYTLSFTPTTGSVSNPQVVYSLFTLDTSLEANNSGYYYSWTATEDGAVSFWVDEENSTKVPYDIILSSSGSYSSPALSESENGVVSMTVMEGDVVTIHVTTVSDSGSNPAAYLAVRGAIFTGDGTENDPYMTTVINIPGGLATVEIPNGSEVSYSVYRIGDSILTIEDEDAYVIYNGVTYTAENGIVTVKLEAVMPMTPTSLIVGNLLTDQEKADKLEEETEAYLIRIQYPLGVYGNPEVLDDISSMTTNVEAGNETGYYYKWTAEEAGTVTFWVTGATEGVDYNVTLSSSDSYSQPNLAGSGDGTVSIDVEAGSVVTVIVAALPDDNGNYPAAVIEVSGTFTPAVQAALFQESEEPETAAAEPPAPVTEPEEKTVSEPEPTCAQNTEAEAATEPEPILEPAPVGEQNTEIEASVEAETGEDPTLEPEPTSEQNTENGNEAAAEPEAEPET